MQVNLDHAHTALPTQTSPKPAAHQRYLAVLLLLFALCLLLHVATQCAAHFEVLARISLLFTSSECDLNNEPKLNLFLLSHRLSKHLFPSVPSCTFGSPVHDFQSTDEGTRLDHLLRYRCCARCVHSSPQLRAPTYDCYSLLCRSRMPWPLLACWQCCHQQQMQGGCFSLPPSLMQTFSTLP